LPQRFDLLISLSHSQLTDIISNGPAKVFWRTLFGNNRQYNANNELASPMIEVRATGRGAQTLDRFNIHCGAV
jgi:hypothetical protein